MGVIQHHAIIATTYDRDVRDRLSQVVIALGVSAEIPCFFFLPTDPNGYYTFVLPPDGSKEGWPESDKGDEVRGKIIEAIKEEEFGDGSNPWSWVEVTYGEKGIDVRGQK